MNSFSFTGNLGRDCRTGNAGGTAARQSASKGSASLAADELKQCADMDSLAKLFGELYNKYRGDNASIRIITRAKDERKMGLAQDNGQGFNPAQVAEPTKEDAPAPVEQQAPANPESF